MEQFCTNKNYSYKHNEQINKQNIDNSECFGVKYVKMYPEMTSQWFFEKNMVLVDYIGIFLHFRILLTDDGVLRISCKKQYWLSVTSNLFLLYIKVLSLKSKKCL